MNLSEAFDYLINQIRAQTNDNSSRYVIPEDLARPMLNYQSIRTDLKLIREAAILLMTPELDQTISASLWHTVIVLYGKCFTSTNRSAKLEANHCYSMQDKKFQELHDKLIDLRHNFVAHRGKTIHEYALAYIRIDPEKNESEVKIEHLKRNRPERHELLLYVEMFEHLISFTEDKIRKTGNKIVKRLFQTTTPNPLYKI
jgi:hypothetical protein